MNKQQRKRLAIVEQEMGERGKVIEEIYKLTQACYNSLPEGYRDRLEDLLMPYVQENTPASTVKKHKELKEKSY